MRHLLTRRLLSTRGLLPTRRGQTSGEVVNEGRRNVGPPDEFRRRLALNKLDPLHPAAGGTDDVCADDLVFGVVGALD